ncbi:MAG TPA: baseplate J/gp47 family protein [Ktedonobacteraceae bacterium]|nr:baseplate J/gp47 family protein [Ktedonobacteraceae bacterium]
MDEQVQQQIKEFLEHLDAQTDTALPSIDEQQQGTEVIDVFIVRRQMEEPEPPTVESTLADTSDEQETPAAPTEQETAELPVSLPLKPRRRMISFFIGALCLLLVVALGGVTLLITFAPSATVTIIPTSMQITTTRAVSIVASNVNAAQQQIPGRLLETITLSQAKTVPATGTGHQQARAAQGFITFYNALPAPQTIPAGELLTGADGVEVVTLQDAVIPAGTLATNGQVTVAAQAVNAGPQGNIAAGEIYGKCCRDDVFVSNGPFRGGQNARSYQMVTQQDIDSVVLTLKTSLDQRVQAALSQQVQPNETLVTPVPCSSRVAPDHQAGNEATQVSVMVSETCTGEVYTTSALHALLMQVVSQQAAKRLGKSYSLVGDLQTSITQAAINTRQGTANLQVKTISTWVYRFSQAQQQQLKLTIRGKSKSEATALLLHTPGVQTVSLSIKNGTIIPTDIQQIHLVFIEIL